jgi:hypothetical protein
VNDTCDVGAEDIGVGLDECTVILDLPVDGVDGHGGVVDYDFVGGGGGERSGVHNQGVCFDGFDPGGGVGHLCDGL